jgi:hypothetical protein
MTAVDSRATGREHSPFVPLLILLIAIAAWFGFQGYTLWNERNALAASQSSQERALEGARKVRITLDTLARETALLADKGNANARLIVDELKRRGVTIDPTSPPLK